MSTFTEELKNEIIQKPIESERCRIAFLSAYIRTSGSVISVNGNYGFEIVTENERTAEFVCDLFETFEILEKLGVLKMHSDGVSLVFGISDKLIIDEDCMSSYIKGAFLGGGSCTLPEEQTYSRTGYHFEVVFSNRITASDYCELLCGFEVLAKLVTRKDSAVVYVKSKEIISDLLSVMQADKCLKKLNRIVEKKDRSNNENRVSNCSVSNIDKALTAYRKL